MTDKNDKKIKDENVVAEDVTIETVKTKPVKEVKEKATEKKAEKTVEVKEEIKMPETSRIIEPEKKEEAVVYGSAAGNRCPSCKQGTMVKIGGCTECSNQCGFKGSCEV